MSPADVPVPPAPPVDVSVAVASAGAEWEPALLGRIEAHRSGMHLVRRCVDLADLLAVSQAGRVDVAVVDASLPRLDRDEVARLRACGTAVLLVEGSETSGVALGLGVSDVAHPGIGVDSLAAQVRHLGADRAPTPTPPSFVADDGAGSNSSRGRLVVVCGPNGAPGRSIVAVNLAAESALTGTSTLLVDADSDGGAISPMLGLLDEAPGLAAACRGAARGRLDVGVLAAHALQVDDHLRVLTGATRSDRWRELRPAALDTVWETARLLADTVVVDVAAGWTELPADPFEQAAITPATVASAVVAAADLVVVVGTADPVGMLRLVQLLDQLNEAEVSTPRLVVVNRVRQSVLGRQPRRQVREAMQRFTGVRDVQLLLDDPAAADRALRSGQPLASVAPESMLRTGVVELLAATDPGRATAAGGRRRRRQHRRSVPSPA